MENIRVWASGKQELHFPDQSSLDAITRQLPEGFYSTFRTYAGCTRVLGLRDHFRRLYEVSAPEVGASELRRQLISLLEHYRPGEARVRLIMTEAGRVYIAIEPLRLLPRPVFERGVRVETTELARDHPRLKSTAFITASELERRHLAHEGIFEALLVKRGRILEGMTSNFFYVKDSVLYTARRDILLGVTRRNVLRVARGRGVEVRYLPLKLSQLAAADEAFITSSSRGIVPVIRIDNVTVGQGRPGKLTKQLSEAYETYVVEKADVIQAD